MPDVQKDLESLEQKEKEIKTAQQELDAVKTETEDYENKKSALQKELDRVVGDITAKREERRALESKDKSFVERLRNENLEKAKTKLVEKYGYKDKPEALKSLEDTFLKLDTQAVSEDKIYQDLVKSHLFINSDRYLKLEEDMDALKKGGADFLADMSSSANIGNQPSPNESVELDEADLKAAKWAGVPLEKYRELKKQGRI